MTKTSSSAVEHFLRACIDTKSVQVAFLQGAVPLQTNLILFQLLLSLITQTKIWSINLGELTFSPKQMDSLKKALADSMVSFMFYECDKQLELKRPLQNIIRTNRGTHEMWKISSDATQNNVIKHSQKNW